MKKIVVVGGGTGSHNILKGLKEYTNETLDLTAIVSMVDNGGSTGRLREEYGILPPGDLRKCLLALSDETESVKNLFEYRFPSGSLKGHVVGNVLFTALTTITGSSEKALKEVSRVFKVKGDILPITLDNVHLYARLEDGTVIEGESNIDIPKHDGNLRIEAVYLQPPARAYEDALIAIKNADFIVIGPGDLYANIISNILVSGVPEAIRNSKAQKIYVCNLMTKYGETDGYSAADYIRSIERYLGAGIIDSVIVNNGKIPKRILKEYEKERAYPVKYDVHEIYELGIETVVEAAVINKHIPVSHDSRKITEQIMRLGAN
jgi:uncharacterized cofD-like protein